MDGKTRSDSGISAAKTCWGIKKRCTKNNISSGGRREEVDEWMMASWDNDPVKDWIEAQLDGDTGSVPWVLRSDALYPNGHVCFVCWQVQMERNIYNGVSRGVSRQLPCMVSSSTVNGPRCNEWVHLPTHSTAVSEVRLYIVL